MALRNRSAIVTGAGRGIGRSIALAFAKEGAKVLVADINSENAQQVAGEISSLNSEAYAVRADVSKSPEVHNMVETAIDKLGGIDILVNNAAVNFMSPFWELDENKWDTLFDVNVKSVFLCCKAVVPHMIRNGRGKIVNISSWLGKRAIANFAHYSATKFAVMALTQALAMEVARYNINVNAVCPGNVKTGIWDPLIPPLAKSLEIPEDKVFEKFVEGTPFKRPQTPDDIANAVLFLCRDEAKEITGEALCVTGGVEYA